MLASLLLAQNPRYTQNVGGGWSDSCSRAPALRSRSPRFGSISAVRLLTVLYFFCSSGLRLPRGLTPTFSNKMGARLFQQPVSGGRHERNF